MCRCCSSCRKRGICTGTDWYDSVCPKTHSTCKLRKMNEGTPIRVSLSKYEDFNPANKMKEDR